MQSKTNIGISLIESMIILEEILKKIVNFLINFKDHAPYFVLLNQKRHTTELWNTMRLLIMKMELKDGNNIRDSRHSLVKRLRFNQHLNQLISFGKTVVTQRTKEPQRKLLLPLLLLDFWLRHLLSFSLQRKHLLLRKINILKLTVENLKRIMESTLLNGKMMLLMNSKSTLL